jgi:hypothetical protein
MMRWGILCFCLWAHCAASCDRLSDFRREGGRDFVGSIIGGQDDSFIRKGFPASTELRLHFDIDADENASPGHLTTSDRDALGAPTFDVTPLEVIPGLMHDQLSQFDFPGAERLKNYLYYARPAQGALSQTSAMVVVSLLSSQGAEVRIMARGSGGEPVDYFGIFPLRIE